MSNTDKKPDEYLVQTQRAIESYEFPMMKTGRKDERGQEEIAPVPKSNPVKVTKLVKGTIGPFVSRSSAEQVAMMIAGSPGLVSAHVITVVDGPEEGAERQVPPSEDVLREMIARGGVPGVKPDAEVKVEGNTVPFPSASPSAPAVDASPEG